MSYKYYKSPECELSDAWSSCVLCNSVDAELIGYGDEDDWDLTTSEE